jgi:hypothetical protein
LYEFAAPGPGGFGDFHGTTTTSLAAKAIADDMDIKTSLFI